MSLQTACMSSFCGGALFPPRGSIRERQRSPRCVFRDLIGCCCFQRFFTSCNNAISPWSSSSSERMNAFTLSPIHPRSQEVAATTSDVALMPGVAEWLFHCASHNCGESIDFFAAEQCRRMTSLRRTAAKPMLQVSIIRKAWHSCSHLRHFLDGWRCLPDVQVVDRGVGASVMTCDIC